MKKKILLIILASVLYNVNFAQKKDSVTIGVVTDIQYARSNKPGMNRHYTKGIEQLSEAVDQFNKTENLSFAIDLGDMTDREYSEYAEIATIKTRLNAQWHNVYGNHDFLSAKNENEFHYVAEMKGMNKPYYSIVKNGIRFIFINCSDIATHSSIEGTEKNNIARQWFEDLASINAPSARSYNGGIGLKQLTWLDKELCKADKKGQIAIVCGHMLIYPFNTAESLWNGMEVTHLIESHSSTKAVFCGHSHNGGYHIRNGIHYVNFKGMVEGDYNHFAVVTINPSRKTITINGFGDEPDQLLNIK